MVIPARPRSTTRSSTPPSSPQSRPRRGRKSHRKRCWLASISQQSLNWPYTFCDHLGSFLLHRARPRSERAQVSTDYAGTRRFAVVVVVCGVVWCGVNVHNRRSRRDSHSRAEGRCGALAERLGARPRDAALLVATVGHAGLKIELHGLRADGEDGRQSAPHLGQRGRVVEPSRPWYGAPA